jgi:threonyl-tRNA synthetase
MLVVGEREAADGSVAVRRRDGVQAPSMKIAEFAGYALNKVATQDLEL